MSHFYLRWEIKVLDPNFHLQVGMHLSGSVLLSPGSQAITGSLVPGSPRSRGTLSMVAGDSGPSRGRGSGRCGCTGWGHSQSFPTHGCVDKAVFIECFSTPCWLFVIVCSRCIFRMEPSKKLILLTCCSLQREMSQECVKIKL